MIPNFSLLFLLLLSLTRILEAFTHTCDPTQLVQAGREHNQTYFVFAITQDCQLIFARADQLNQFRGLAVDIRQHITYCLPNLVQFHWQSRKPNGNLSLKMVFKRANNQICILPIDFPRQSALVGDQIFRYSLLNSLTYAICSYMPNSSFAMEPELSFMDSVYLDVIYFVDPKSAGSFWTIRQFKMDSQGYLKALETFVVKNFAEEPDFVSRTAGEHLLALDSQKLRLYSAHKLHKDMSSTCAYDLLFRPHKARINRHRPERTSHNTFRLNSYSVDKNTTLFVESQRNTQNGGFQSRLFVAERQLNHSAKCLLELPYALKMELISEQALEKLREKQLPKFESAINKSHHKHWTKSSGRHSTKWTTTTTKLPSTVNSVFKETTRPSLHFKDDQTGQSEQEEKDLSKNKETPDQDNESKPDHDDESKPDQDDEDRQHLTEEEMAGDDHQHLTEEEMGSDDDNIIPYGDLSAENERLQNGTDSSSSRMRLPTLSLICLHLFAFSLEFYLQ